MGMSRCLIFFSRLLGYFIIQMLSVLQLTQELIMVLVTYEWYAGIIIGGHGVVPITIGDFFLCEWLLIFFSFSIVKLAMVIFSLISCIIHFLFFRIRLISSSCQIWEICLCSRLIFPSNLSIQRGFIPVFGLLVSLPLSCIALQAFTTE